MRMSLRGVNRQHVEMFWEEGENEGIIPEDDTLSTVKWDDMSILDLASHNQDIQGQ